MLRFCLLLLAVLIVSAACDNRPANNVPSASPTPQPAAEILALTGRVTFYATEAGDSAGTLAAGDFNGDGHTDALLAAALADGPDNSRADSGEAFVFLGPFAVGEMRDAAKEQQDTTIYGAKEGDQLGRAAATGDFNGDGIDDIVLAAPFADGESREDSGVVYVFFGSTDLGKRAVIDLAEEGPGSAVLGADPGDLAGFVMETAEVNGDKLDDLIIGAFAADGPENTRVDAGEVYVILGRAAWDGFDLRDGDEDVLIYGAAPGDRLGEAVAAGDVNGDGPDDLVVPSPFAVGRGGQGRAGQTYVLLAPPSELLDLSSASPATTVYGADEGDQLGHSLAVGDANGDGVGDVLLGAVSADGLGNAAHLAGEAALIRGGVLVRQVDVAAGQAASVIYGADAGDRLGRTVATGDVDANGLSDLLLGAPGGDGPREMQPGAGEVYVISGSVSLPGEARLPAVAQVIQGADQGDGLSTSVFGKPSLLARDLNGDGRDEILVAAPLGDGPENARRNCGEAYILFVEAPPASRSRAAPPNTS